jgi:hypothetical protein
MSGLYSSGYVISANCGPIGYRWEIVRRSGLVGESGISFTTKVSYQKGILSQHEFLISLSAVFISSGPQPLCNNITSLALDLQHDLLLHYSSR